MVQHLYTRALAVAALAALAACGPAQRVAEETPRVAATTSGPPAKELFSAVQTGSDQRPQPLGGHSRGCQAGALELEETGPTWQAMRLSRNRNWAQPSTIDYIKTLSAEVAKLPGWEGLYVGDLSLPRGGPVSGHVSHQSGLDVDIWMLPPSRLDLTAAERESLSSISMRRAQGAFVNESWTQSHRDVLKLAASDPRVTRLFVFPGAKVDMCQRETGDRSYLQKIRPWWGHHFHFHVRLACPRGARGCTEQAPPPPGDGCDEAQGWVDRILDPPPPDPDAPAPQPRRELTMADLPQECSAVLASQ